MPGWTGEYEWTGYIPFDQLPRLFNPEQGYIVTANNRIAGDEYPYLIGNSYAAPYRASRIVEMIESRSAHSPDDMAAMQSDVLALHARELLPVLLRTPASDSRGKSAIEFVRTWDMRVTESSSQAAIFEAWYTALGRRLFADELGEDLWRTYSNNVYVVGMALSETLRNQNAWCDDVRTPITETCAATLAAALTDALAQMSTAWGDPLY